MSKKINPVNWFEIPVTDLERAKTFYEGAFGVALSVQERGPAKIAVFPGGSDATGAAGSLVEAEGYTPSKTGSVVYMHVSDVDTTLNEIAKRGGKILKPKTSIGEHGFIAYFEDTEGNRVALHQRP